MDFYTPLLLSLIAGMATGIGGTLVLLLGELNDRVVGFAMGVASGVMLLVSFNNLFLEAMGLLTHFQIILLFSLGAFIIICLDLVLPHIESTSRASTVSAGNQNRAILIATGFSLHHLPEGMVIAAGYNYMPRIGMIILIAMLLHNIPEGVTISLLLRNSGMKPRKVVIISFLSGLTESLGTLIGLFILSFVGMGSAVGPCLAFTAGVMIYLTADELIPVAHEYGYKHTVSVGVLLGIVLALLIDVMLN